MTPFDGRADERRLTLRVVTWLMSAVIALTFLFGFGNVWALAVRLGVPPWVAPPGGVHLGPDERLVVIPGNMLSTAKADIPTERPVRVVSRCRAGRQRHR